MAAKHIRIAQTEGVEAGFAAYCASVTSGQGLALAPVRAKAESILGKRLNPERKGALEAYIKAFGLGNVTIEKAAEARGDGPADIAQIVAAVLVALGNEPEATEDKRERREVPADAARNAVLWRLNVEGLLAEALDASDEDYITQEAGRATLTLHFGEQS